jgi:hypothetical protein
MVVHESSRKIRPMAIRLVGGTLSVDISGKRIDRFVAGSGLNGNLLQDLGIGLR